MESKTIGYLKSLKTGTNEIINAMYFDKSKNKYCIWPDGGSFPIHVSASELPKYKTMMLRFSDENVWSVPIVINDILNKDEVDRAYKFLDYWMKHSQCVHALNENNHEKKSSDLVDYIKWNEKYFNPHLIDPKIKVEPLEEIKDAEFSKIETFVEAMNLILSFDEAKIVDVMYFFSLSPATDREDNIIKLIHPSTGLFLNEALLKKFHLYFGKNSVKSDAANVEVLIQKALMLRKADGTTFIETKGDKYYYGGDPIADDYDKLKIYVRDNKSFAKIISDAIKELETKNKVAIEKIDNATGYLKKNKINT